MIDPSDRRRFLQLSAAAGAALAFAPLDAVSALAQQRGGTLRIGVPESFSSLDPYKKIGRLDYNAVINIFDTLVTYGPDYVPKPMLAQSWTRVDDLTWRFALSPGVTFHDGTPFDAEAAKFSIELMRTSNFAGQFKPIKEVAVTGPLAIEVRCATPFPTLPVQLTQQYASIVSPTAYRSAGDAFGRRPVGSGPFKVESLESSRELVLVRNPDYWRKDAAGHPLPYVDRVRWQVLPDDATALIALRNEEIDFLYAVPEALTTGLAGDPRTTLYETPTLGWQYVMFHVGHAPFDNVHLRRAVQLAIDRKAIVDTVSFGRGAPALGPIAPRSWAYDPAIETGGFYGIRADKDKARQELEAAGVPGGFEFTLQYPSMAPFDAIAQVVQAQLAEVGIKVLLDGKEIGALLDELFASKFSALLIDWSGRIDEALAMPSFFTTGGGNNFGAYANARVDTLLQQAGVATDIAARAGLYRQAQALIVQDSPHVWISNPAELRASRKAVSGFVDYGDVRLRADTIALDK